MIRIIFNAESRQGCETGKRRREEVKRDRVNSVRADPPTKKIKLTPRWKTRNGLKPERKQEQKLESIPTHVRVRSTNKRTSFSCNLIRINSLV